MAERFSELRGLRVIGGDGATLGFVVDAIVRPRGDRMVVTELMVVPRRLGLLAARSGVRRDSFAVAAAGLRRAGADALQLDAREAEAP